MKLEIISPLQTKVYRVAWLELNTNVGNFVVQKGYTPTLFILKPNSDIVFRLDNGKHETMFVPSGITEVTRDSATVIINEKALPKR